MVLPGGMNGPELAAKAAKRHPGIEVLYLSGHAPDVARPQDWRDNDAEAVSQG